MPRPRFGFYYTLLVNSPFESAETLACCAGHSSERVPICSAILQGSTALPPAKHLAHPVESEGEDGQASEDREKVSAGETHVERLER